MADKKITGLTELTTIDDQDPLAVADDPSGSPVTKKITKANFVKDTDINLKAATEKTISAGAITATQSAHKLQPQSGTADDLDTINGLSEGDVLWIYISDEGTDTITIKHGTGNISCIGDADVALSEGAAIFYSDGTTAYLIGGGGGSLDIDGLAVATPDPDADYVPFYDGSASANKKALWPVGNVTAKTGVATLTVAERGTILVSAAGAAYTITLPTAVGNIGLMYHFMKTDANYTLITLDANGAQTFNFESSTGAPVLTYTRLNTYCAEATVVSDGANWQVINEALGQVPECRVYLSGNMDNIVNATWTKVTLDTEDYDIGTNFAANKFVAPIAGRYMISNNIKWYGGLVSGTKVVCAIYKGGVNLQSGDWHISRVDWLSTSTEYIGDLAALDEIESYAYSTVGGNTADIHGAAESTFIYIKLLAKA